MLVNMYKIIFGVYAIFGVVAAKSPCKTADGEHGQCIDVYSCLQLLEETPHLPPATNELFGHTLEPGCDKTNPLKVCCGSSKKPADPDKKKRIRRGVSCGTDSGIPDPSSGCCGVDADGGPSKIFGPPPSTDMYPWLALIEYDSGYKTKTLCSGALISPRYVLTAAHCVKINVVPKSVRLGEYDIAKEGPDCYPIYDLIEDCTDGAVNIDIEKIIVHPKYNVKKLMEGHDIALIRLKNPAPYNDFIRPICLPTSNIATTDSASELTQSGWALHDKPQNNVKLDQYMYYVNNTECNAKYAVPHQVPIKEGQICARRDKKESIGDSGGPLVRWNHRSRYYDTIGISSFGPLRYEADSPPDVFTDVFAYKDWIMSNIEA